MPHSRFRAIQTAAIAPIADVGSEAGSMPIGAVPNTDALLKIAYEAAEAGNLQHARRCYESGAALGDAMCLQALGYMYDVGEGIAADKALAMRLYRKAWKRGSHAAAINIAILYREMGKKRTMFRWFERVARAGDGSAQLEMAKCYLNGAGVRKDVQAALRCLAAANASCYIAECEREEAQAILAKLKPGVVNGGKPPNGRRPLPRLQNRISHAALSPARPCLPAL